MNQFIESLRRLYLNKKITKEKVIALFDDKKITQEEKIYILSI